MIELNECQSRDLDRICQAIADSYKMQPRSWMCRHGGISCIARLPSEYQQLVCDYKETKVEMLERCEKWHG